MPVVSPAIWREKEGCLKILSPCRNVTPGSGNSLGVGH